MNPAPFDQLPHPKLIVEHYSDPLTFQPPQAEQPAETEMIFTVPVKIANS
jgi:hypothetical protein